MQLIASMILFVFSVEILTGVGKMVSVVAFPPFLHCKIQPCLTFHAYASWEIKSFKYQKSFSLRKQNNNGKIILKLYLKIIKLYYRIIYVFVICQHIAKYENNKKYNVYSE